MHGSNHYYGHAEILGRYCGLGDHPPPIVGTLQHGWNPLHGHGLVKARPDRGTTNLVWSDAARRRGHALDWTDHAVVGAPWLYLLTMVEPAAPADDREGTIFYPFHGAEIGGVTGDHRGLVEEVRDTEDGPVTACLYWFEYEQAEVRALYASAGFRVICHGYRGTKFVGTDPGFLVRQHDELTRHCRVISNRVSTAVFYGASVGCDVGVYGDPMAYQGDDPAAERLEHVQRLLPHLHGARTDADAVRATCDEELGRHHVLPPQALRRLLGWAAAA